jgi:hypothetical protein
MLLNKKLGENHEAGTEQTIQCSIFTWRKTRGCFQTLSPASNEQGECFLWIVLASDSGLHDTVR